MISDVFSYASVVPDFEITFSHLVSDYESIQSKSGSKSDTEGYKKTLEELSIKPYFTFSPTSDDFSGKNIQSYTFSTSTDDITGSFSITVKEDTKSLKSSKTYFLDQVEELDLVTIKEGGTVEFYGIVRTISFGATAGAFNKAITISGTSAAGLLNMYKISTDLTITNFFNGTSNNISIADQLARAFLKSDTGAVNVEEIFRIIYNDFVEVGKMNSNIASTKIQRLFRFIFGVSHETEGQGVEFLDCDLKSDMQLVANLYGQSECNVISYFKGLMPENIYEIFYFQQRKDTKYKKYNKPGKPLIKIREMPFSAEDWKNLNKIEIRPVRLTDYTLTKTDTNIFTAFYAWAEGSPANAEFYKKIGAEEKGNKVMNIDDELVQLYGYIPLEVSFIGYKDKTKDKDESIMKNKSSQIADWYRNLKDMWNGDITLVNLWQSEKNPRIGERIGFCGGEFYVKTCTHTWQYGNGGKINLAIERGGIYKGGKFQAGEKLSLSKTFAELLEK